MRRIVISCFLCIALACAADTIIYTGSSIFSPGGGAIGVRTPAL